MSAHGQAHNLMAGLARVWAEGPWQVGVEVPRKRGAPRRTVLEVAGPARCAVVAERYDSLPQFNPTAAGWLKGVALRAVRAQECTACFALDPASLEVRSGAGPDGTRLEQGKGYEADLRWATVGRLPAGTIRENQPVWISYRYTPQRLDSVVLTAEGGVALRRGAPHIAAPRPPDLAAGETRLANLWLHCRQDQLTEDDLFPILENSFPEEPVQTPSPAERLLPVASRKLLSGEPLRILAWGDSVTDAGHLAKPEEERWQAQFVRRLKGRFPRAVIELCTESWPGRNTATYLGEPPGAEHNYREKVLDVHPDLIVFEFVNDSGLALDQVEANCRRILADFRTIGAEWIILTPHYVRPDWMGLTHERDIDDDPRPYVAFLRRFAQEQGVALADAARRYGRLWRQGIPYSTLMVNNINHPDVRGMALFADSLMALFRGPEEGA